MAEEQAIPSEIVRAARELLRQLAWIAPEEDLRTDLVARDLLAAELRGMAAERERCIRLIDCGCERDHCGCPGNCAKDDIEAIRTEP